MNAIDGILISGKIDSKTKCVTRHKEKRFMMIKKFIQKKQL